MSVLDDPHPVRAATGQRRIRWFDHVVMAGRPCRGPTGEDGRVGSSSLAGQVAVVTGASRGIGRVVAVHLAACGAAVAGVARPSPELRELAEAGGQAGHRLVTLPADVTVPAELDAAFAAAAAELGPPTLVIAAAGTADALGPVAEADPNGWTTAGRAMRRGPRPGVTARVSVDGEGGSLIGVNYRPASSATTGARALAASAPNTK
jgi:short chain dehydrogenase